MSSTIAYSSAPVPGSEVEPVRPQAPDTPRPKGLTLGNPGDDVFPSMTFDDEPAPLREEAPVPAAAPRQVAAPVLQKPAGVMPHVWEALMRGDEVVTALVNWAGSFAETNEEVVVRAGPAEFSTTVMSIREQEGQVIVYAATSTRLRVAPKGKIGLGWRGREVEELVYEGDLPFFGGLPFRAMLFSR